MLTMMKPSATTPIIQNLDKHAGITFEEIESINPLIAEIEITFNINIQTIQQRLETLEQRTNEVSKLCNYRVYHEQNSPNKSEVPCKIRRNIQTLRNSLTPNNNQQKNVGNHRNKEEIRTEIGLTLQLLRGNERLHPIHTKSMPNPN